MLLNTRFAQKRHGLARWAGTFGAPLPICDARSRFFSAARKNQGYYLAETEPLLAEHERLLEAVELQEFLQLPVALGQHVQPEARRPLDLAHLRPLLRAAQARQVVEFQYQKHWEATPEPRTVGPLLLKEFRGRWYVLATMVWSGYLAYFGLDRISGMRTTGQSFIPPAGFEAATYYAHAFGITRPNDGQPPQEIVLRFAPRRGATYSATRCTPRNGCCCKATPKSGWRSRYLTPTTCAWSSSATGRK